MMTDSEVHETLLTLKESMKNVIEGCELLLETDQITYKRLNQLIDTMEKINARVLELELKVAALEEYTK